jgi:hypothetical protein
VALAFSNCAALAQSAWPVTTSARARLLSRLEDQRELCNENAAFLALLGALWLEQGDATQALLWLERSLMLDPGAPGSQADHALALAALGEKTAVVELLQRWGDRQDIPPALRARLAAARAPAKSAAPSSAATASALPAVGSGVTWRRTVSLMRGNETNLDHSPRLSEITLSDISGPIEVPLAVPIVPRSGFAWTGDAALQALYSPEPGTMWQGGLQVSGRHSAAEPGTDTRQLQLAATRWRQHDGWRSQTQLSVQRISGPLNEPFNTYLLGYAGEREWNGCWSRAGLDVEWRRQDLTQLADSYTFALQSGVNCKLKPLPGWHAGLALRLGVDRPREPARPGGTQQQASVGLRASGPVGFGFRLEMSARVTGLHDREGYSPLLENDARRRQTQQQTSVEISRPLPGLYVSGLDLVFQIQQLRQTSNIALFRQTGRAAYAGLRLDW